MRIKTLSALSAALPTLRRRLPLAIVAVLLLASSMPALSNAHEQIRSAVYTAVSQHVRAAHREATVQVTPPSKQLKLAQCLQSPQVTIPRSARLIGAINASVRCDNPRWQLTVRANVQARGEVLVTTRSIARGEQLTASDVRVVARNLSREPHDVIGERERAVGRRTRRPMAAGTTLNEGSLAPRVMVQSGQTVVMEAGSSGYLVRTEGIALVNGDRGDLIRVRNQSSGAIVQVQVTDFGTVRVAGH